MTIIRNKQLIGAILIFSLQLIAYYYLRFFPEFIETYYSNGIYPYISKAMRIGLGWIPFSFGDLVYGIGIIMILRWLWMNKAGLITLPFGIMLSRKHNQKEACAALDAVRKRYYTIFTTLNIILITFHLLWGFNYYRLPLNERLELASEYSDDDLEKVTTYFITEANKLHLQLQPVDSLAVDFKRNQQELFAIARNTNQIFDDQYKDFNQQPLSVKKSLLTVPLTYMGYSGYLNPITGEAHTNGKINNYKTPVLILHEMAHQQGFAKENEANFFGVMAGINHDDPYYQYSAMIFGLRYLLNDLYRKQPEKASLLKDQMRSGILANYQELTDFWEPYQDNIIEKASQATYNQYLKANNQPDGMRTYSYVVALLVNYFVDNSKT